MFEALLKDTARFIGREELIPARSRVLVACSGGADSLTLLDILWRLASLSRYDFRVEAAHFEHGIRLADGASRRDAAFVNDFCLERGIPFTLEHADVPGEARARGLSLETAARLARYRFLERTRVRRGLTLIATAHQADDQAETVLMRILRGTGTLGLGAMRPRAMGHLPLIRPLLFATRREIERYVAQRGLTPCEDETNGEADFTRNRLRLVTLPRLREEYNPRLVEALCSLSEVCAADADFIESEAGKAFEGLLKGERLRVRPVLELHTALQRAVLRLFWERRTGARADLPFAHAERLRLLLGRAAAGGRQELPHGYVMTLLREEGELLASLDN